MTARVRRAGRAILPDGRRIVWSAADGRRGRRWRASIAAPGGLASVLLLEVNPDGRLARLELATATGLLTLHPEPADELHGNMVTPDGVRHVAIPWGDTHVLEIDGQPIATAVTAAWLARRVAVGEGTSVPVVIVGEDLAIRTGTLGIRHLAEGSWQLDVDGNGRTVTIDSRGLPVWPVAGMEWPLELDDRG
jgi:hypothetical protein